MSGHTTFRVVKPKSPRLLSWRLRRAGERERTTKLWAISLDDPRKKPTPHEFVVRVIERGFTPPKTFEAIDQEDGHFLRIWFRENGLVEFTIFYS